MNAETLYADFTAKILPQINEGFAMTKEYFVELFGRYVQYLLISDALQVVGSVIGVILLVKWIQWGHRNKGNLDELIVPVIIFGAIGILFLGIMFVVKVNHVIKDIYIPEVRVYESLTPTK